MAARQDFAFKIDNVNEKLITVVHQGRSIEVTVRYVAEVVLGQATTRIGNVTAPSSKPTSRAWSSRGGRRCCLGSVGR